MSPVVAFDSDALGNLWNKAPSGTATRDPSRSFYSPNPPPLGQVPSWTPAYDSAQISHYHPSSNNNFAPTHSITQDFHHHASTSPSITMSAYPQHDTYDTHQRQHSLPPGYIPASPNPPLSSSTPNHHQHSQLGEPHSPSYSRYTYDLPSSGNASSAARNSSQSYAALPALPSMQPDFSSATPASVSYSPSASATLHQSSHPISASSTSLTGSPYAYPTPHATNGSNSSPSNSDYPNYLSSNTPSNRATSASMAAGAATSSAVASTAGPPPPYPAEDPVAPQPQRPRADFTQLLHSYEQILGSLPSPTAWEDDRERQQYSAAMLSRLVSTAVSGLQNLDPSIRISHEPIDAPEDKKRKVSKEDRKDSVSSVSTNGSPGGGGAKANDGAVGAVGKSSGLCSADIDPVTLAQAMQQPIIRTKRRRMLQKCLSCNSTSTPEWRKGPMGPRTLCNACGLVWAKVLRKRALAEAKSKKNGNGDLNAPAEDGIVLVPVRGSSSAAGDNTDGRMSSGMVNLGMPLSMSMPSMQNPLSYTSPNQNTRLPSDDTIRSASYSPTMPTTPASPLNSRR